MGLPSTASRLLCLPGLLQSKLASPKSSVSGMLGGNCRALHRCLDLAGRGYPQPITTVGSLKLHVLADRARRSSIVAARSGSEAGTPLARDLLEPGV
jgi:hypothetical protein